ncbi:MAG: hypothetical protein VKJ06_05855 [Vampirovibrionales bacterium]|nr:hypothetical protein [Vampirovibrionales bacterium]
MSFSKQIVLNPLTLPTVMGLSLFALTASGCSNAPQWVEVAEPPALVQADGPYPSATGPVRIDPKNDPWYAKKKTPKHVQGMPKTPSETTVTAPQLLKPESLTESESKRDAASQAAETSELTQQGALASKTTPPLPEIPEVGGLNSFGEYKDLAKVQTLGSGRFEARFRQAMHNALESGWLKPRSSQDVFKPEQPLTRKQLHDWLMAARLRGFKTPPTGETAQAAVTRLTACRLYASVSQKPSQQGAANGAEKQSTTTETDWELLGPPFSTTAEQAGKIKGLETLTDNDKLAVARAYQAGILAEVMALYPSALISGQGLEPNRTLNRAQGVVLIDTILMAR